MLLNTGCPTAKWWFQTQLCGHNKLFFIQPFLILPTCMIQIGIYAYFFQIHFKTRVLIKEIRKNQIWVHLRRTINGFKSCGELCKMCAFSPQGITKKHTCKYTGESQGINSPINCKTPGVIYQITCNKCPDFIYIGETGRPVKQRFSEHYRDATNKDKT